MRYGNWFMIESLDSELLKIHCHLMMTSAFSDLSLFYLLLRVHINTRGYVSGRLMQYWFTRECGDCVMDMCIYYKVNILAL